MLTGPCVAMQAQIITHTLSHRTRLGLEHAPPGGRLSCDLGLRSLVSALASSAVPLIG